MKLIDHEVLDKCLIYQSKTSASDDVVASKFIHNVNPNLALRVLRFYRAYNSMSSGKIDCIRINSDSIEVLRAEGVGNLEWILKIPLEEDSLHKVIKSLESSRK